MLGLAEVEHRHDALVIEVHAQERLADQPARQRRVARAAVIEQLDGDQLLEAGGAAGDRQVHLSHAASAEAAKEPITSVRPHRRHMYMVLGMHTRGGSHLRVGAPRPVGARPHPAHFRRLAAPGVLARKMLILPSHGRTSCAPADSHPCSHSPWLAPVRATSTAWSPPISATRSPPASAPTPATSPAGWSTPRPTR